MAQREVAQRHAPRMPLRIGSGTRRSSRCSAEWPRPARWWRRRARRAPRETLRRQAWRSSGRDRHHAPIANSASPRKPRTAPSRERHQAFSGCQGSVDAQGPRPPMPAQAPPCGTAMSRATRRAPASAVKSMRARMTSAPSGARQHGERDLPTARASSQRQRHSRPSAARARVASFPSAVAASLRSACVMAVVSRRSAAARGRQIAIDGCSRARRAS